MVQVKDSYKIPESIDVSLMDTPVSFRQGSVGLKRPVTLRVIAISLIALLIYMYAVFKMFTSDFGILSIVIASIGYLWLLSLAIKRQLNGLMGYHWFLPTIKYWLEKDKRYINTRGIAERDEVMKLKFEIPIESYDDTTGKITFTDGSVGAIFYVIGNGSRALFRGDRDEIIDSFAGFLRQLQIGTTLTIDSKQSNQNIDSQLFHLKELKDNTKDPIVEEIIARQITLLEDHIATKFKTTTQHVMFRARNEEALNNDIQQMRQYGVTLFRHADILRGDALTDFLRDFYALS